MTVGLYLMGGLVAAAITQWRRMHKVVIKRRSFSILLVCGTIIKDSSCSITVKSYSKLSNPYLDVSLCLAKKKNQRGFFFAILSINLTR
jgi:hypothetical protein